MFKLAFTCALASAVSEALRIGVVSDMHTNTAYSPTASEDDNCKGSSVAFNSDDYAPIARINCDPSETLVDFMLQRFNEAFGQVDVILVTGDHVAHKVAPHHDVA